MSDPRMCIPGATYMVTRSTTMSLFLLVPGPVVNEILEYCLAFAARGRGIRIHAFSVQSNHYHLVVTDTEGKLSEFMQEFNRCAARCLLAYYRHRFDKTRVDAVWTPAQSFSGQALSTAAAIYRAIAYTLTNPVKDGLVHDYRRWPGLNSRPAEWRGRARAVKRPRYYFRNTPDVLMYRIEPPVQLGDDVDAAIAAADYHVEAAHADAHAAMAAAGRRFMGREAVRAVNPFDAPNTPREEGTMDPAVAAGGDEDALTAATLAIKTFRAAYKEAWERFRDGLDAVFPGGTLLMRKRHRVECTPLDASWCHLAIP